MNLPSYSYNPQMPAACPPAEAEPVGLIYRAIPTLPVRAEHFLSDVEAGNQNAKPSKCSNWGCSVWPTEAAAKHGRDLYDHFKASYIVSGELDPSDGQIMASPSRKQPEHCTFWKVHGLDVSGSFVVVLEPEVPETDDPLGAGEA